jgi:hypothetical protein
MPIRTVILEAMSLLLCLAGLAYGLLMLFRPDVVQKIMRFYARGWHDRGPDPYSKNSKMLGLVYVIACAAFMVWLLRGFLR